jgi:hypothetical protein
VRSNNKTAIPYPGNPADRKNDYYGNVLQSKYSIFSYVMQVLMKKYYIFCRVYKKFVLTAWYKGN